MKLRRILIGLVLLIAVLGGAAAALWYFGDEVPEIAGLKQEIFGAGPEGESEQPPIWIAFVGDLSTEGASGDQMILDGVRMFVNEINAAGGIDGRPLAVQTYDDKGNPGVSANIVDEIVQDDRILAVIGHGSSATTTAAADSYDLYRLPLVTPTATDPQITRDRPYVFRILFTDELQAKVLANYIRSVLGYESTAIVASAGSYAQTLVTAFTDAAEEIALNTSPIFTISPQTTDVQINDIVRRLALMSRLESILLVMQPDDAARIVPKLRASGTKADIIGSDALSQTSAGGEDGSQPAQQPFRAPPFMEDLLLTLPFVPDTASGEARAFLAQFQNVNDRPADWPALYGYDTALILAEAIGRIGPLIDAEDVAEKRVAVRQQLAAMDEPERGRTGLTGLLYFNEQGDVIRPVYLGRVSNGEMTAAAQQLQIIDDPATVEILREEGENTIEVEDVFLQVTQVVRTGIRLISLTDIDPASETFEADFDIWFRYTGNFDSALVEFPNAVDPIHLTEPEQTVDVGREKYEVFRVKGRFRFTPGVETLRTSEQPFRIRYRHAQRDINRLVFLPDLRAMGARPEQGGWETKLKRDDVIEASSGWVIDTATVSQEIQNESTRGNPLIPTVEIPFSSFQASIVAFQGELSLRRQLDAAIPANYKTWLVLIVLVSVIVVTFQKTIRSRFPGPIFVLRLIVTAVLLTVGEDLFFTHLGDQLEIYELANMVNVFSALWWIMPAIWLIYLIRRAVWEPMEVRTGYPVPSIVKTTVNVVIMAVAVILMMNFVLDFSLTSIYAAAGGLTLVLGLALQSLILDAATGLTINLERPFRIGDWIQTGDGVKGRVMEMNWRTTRIWTFTNDELIVPHSVICSSVLTNYNDPHQVTGLEITFRLSFDTPVRYACEQLLQGARDAREAMPSIVEDPEPEANVVSFDAYGPVYSLQVNFDVKDGEWDQVHTAVVAAVQKRLHEAGIELLDMRAFHPALIPT